MPSFDERILALKQQYAAAAATQNLKLFRATMKEHEDLVRDHGPDGTQEVTQSLLASGWRILGKPVSVANIRELIDLVSTVREDMTDSQRMSLFFEELLGPHQPFDDKARAWTDPSPAAKARISRFLAKDAKQERRRGFRYEDIDMTPNRSLGGAALGAVFVLVGGGIVAVLLVLLNVIT